MKAVALVLAALPAGFATSVSAQVNLQAGAGPEAAVNESSVLGAPAASGPAAPPPPLTAPLPSPTPVFQSRSGLQCADFKRALGGGWSALAAVQLPGPRGPLQVAVGQTFTPGDYGAGFDVAAVLERDCPQAPPAGQRPTGEPPPSTSASG